MVRKIINSFKGDNLKAKCTRSSGILGMGTVADKGLAFTSKMILVRLLLQEEIGLMVLILSLTAMFEVFTEVGIKQSVIQNKNGARPGYLNMAWWFQSIRASCLYAAAFSLTPLVCKFYFAGKAEVLDNHTYQELFLMMRLAFLSILFNGFTSPRAHVLEKEFKFFKSMLIIQGSAILGTALTIILALVYRNVWAMIIGFTFMTMLRCVLSFILCPFMPRFEFDMENLREIGRFAKGMFGIPVLTYLAFNIDVLIAGKMVSADLLGMYGMAFALARIPRELFSRIVSPTLLPAFAEKQDDPGALCAAVLRITGLTAFIAIPIVSLTSMFSGTILSIVYGKDFSAVSLSFIFLSIYIVILVQSAILSSVFFAVGHPAKHRFFVGLRAAILLVFIYPLIKFAGVSGAALAVMTANLIPLIFQIKIAGGLIGLEMKQYLISWVSGFFLALPTVLVVFLLKILIPSFARMQMSIGVVCLAVSFILVFLVKNRGLLNKAGAYPSRVNTKERVGIEST